MGGFDLQMKICNAIGLENHFTGRGFIICAASMVSEKLSLLELTFAPSSSCGLNVNRFHIHATKRHQNNIVTSKEHSREMQYTSYKHLLERYAVCRPKLTFLPSYSPTRSLLYKDKTKNGPNRIRLLQIARFADNCLPKLKRRTLIASRNNSN